jgi:hypothetical protein
VFLGISSTYLQSEIFVLITHLPLRVGLLFDFYIYHCIRVLQRNLTKRNYEAESSMICHLQVGPLRGQWCIQPRSLRIRGANMQISVRGQITGDVSGQVLRQEKGV